MTAQWSLVLYTLLTQWAAGLAVFTAWKTRRALRAGERPSGPAWAPVTAAAALGLVMSLFGQWHPGELLPGLEGLAFTVLLAVAFMAWHLRGGKILSVLAASAGVVGVLLQGLRCAPLPAPSPVGVLFLWMFALGAWTLGASFAQLGRGRTGVCPAPAPRLMAFAGDAGPGALPGGDVRRYLDAPFVRGLDGIFALLGGGHGHGRGDRAVLYGAGHRPRSGRSGAGRRVLRAGDHVCGRSRYFSVSAEPGGIFVAQLFLRVIILKK